MHSTNRALRRLGSISVSRQLPTYPSPNPTLTLTCYQLTVVELREGYVGSCPDTDIDPRMHREAIQDCFFNLCRVRNLERYFISPINLCLLAHLRHRMSNECHFASFKFELPLFLFWSVLLYYDRNLFLNQKFCSLITPHLEDFIDPTIFSLGGKG